MAYSYDTNLPAQDINVGANKIYDYSDNALSVADGTFTGDVGIGGDLALIVPQALEGSFFTVSYDNFAAADVAKTFWIAPAACKIVTAYERHVTVAGQAASLTLEKLTAAEAPASGDVLIATGWDLTSTANTSVAKTAVTTAAGTFAAGDALCLKLASGDAASYALGTITVKMQWV